MITIKTFIFLHIAIVREKVVEFIKRGLVKRGVLCLFLTSIYSTPVLFVGTWINL